MSLICYIIYVHCDADWRKAGDFLYGHCKEGGGAGSEVEVGLFIHVCRVSDHNCGVVVGWG